MFKVEKEFSYTYEIKRSKFIAHIFPYGDFDEVMNRLRSEHPKGRHFVYAFRYKNQFGQIEEGSSDDGEPKGTSGKPTLNAFRGAELIDSGVIIVRYFGGIRLGTGGLVRAYTKTTNMVIDESELSPYIEKEVRSYSIPYSLVSKFEYSFKGVEILEKSFNESGLNIKLSGTEEELRGGEDGGFKPV